MTIKANHHESKLAAALDEVYLDGATIIRLDDLYLMFNVDRLSKKPFREIQRHWEDLCETYGHSSAPKLSVLYGSGKSTLTLTREALKGEKWTPLIDWT